MVVALTSGEKALLFVLLLVLLPVVPITFALTRAMRSSRRAPDEREVTSGRAASTPFRLLSVVGAGIAVCVFAALLVVLAAQALADSDDGESVAPVENGGAGAPADETTGSPIPDQGNATAGKAVFLESGCGDCHALEATGATGSVGPSLDESQPDFTTVVECVTTGPGDMPTFASKLSNAEIRNVAKFVAVVTRDGDDR
jgi:mono/diheme cytochrome c family protein